MNKEKIENIINSIILTIEKNFLLNATDLVKPYIDFLFFLIKKYELYDKVDVYLSFVLQLNKYSKKKIRKIVKWVLSKVIPNLDDHKNISRIYYSIARVFLYLNNYNKAQNFAVKALKYYYRSYSEKKPFSSLYYFEIILLISSLAFHRGKFYVSYNLLQYLFSRILDNELEDQIDRNWISLILEAFLWLIISYIYVNKKQIDYSRLKEVVDNFIEIVYIFRNYIDIEKIREKINNILIKRIRNNLFFLSKNSKFSKKYKEIIDILENLYQKVGSIPNTFRIFVSLYKDYIVRFILLYPDNYKIAHKFLMRSIYLNYYYIHSDNLLAISKFLLFKIMNFQKVYSNLTEYMELTDVYEHIVNNTELLEEVKKDIASKKVVYFN